MKIQIFGTGCSKCTKLYELTKEAASEFACDCEIEKITDIQEMMKANVLSTPALSIDGKIRVAGRVPSKDEIKKIIEASAKGSCDVSEKHNKSGGCSCGGCC